MLYAIGDIHGEIEKLNRLLKLLPLMQNDRLIFLGDYVDRGPDPCRVVSRLIDLSSSYDCVFLMGNHESMFLDFLGWPGPHYAFGDSFIMNGGDRTLASYGCETYNLHKGSFKLPSAHRRFFKKLLLYYIEGSYAFVHAGIRRDQLDAEDISSALRNSNTEDLLWNRKIVGKSHQLGVTLVYGHTPRSDFAIRRDQPFSIGIDTGAAYGGPLTALRIPDQEIFQAD